MVDRQRCVAAVAAYVAEAARRGVHPGLVGYEREAARSGWPSRTTITAHLGPWTTALAAAGFSPAPGPCRQACIDAVRIYVGEMASAGRYPSARGYQGMAPIRQWPAIAAVEVQLGSWSQALTDSGFAGARKPGQPYVTREDCVAAVRAYISEARKDGRYPGTVGYDSLARARGWPNRQSTVIPKLGSWAAALAAAGFTARHHPSPKVSRRDALAAVRAYAVERAAAGLAPTSAGYMKLARSRAWPSYSTVLARLGSWRAAMNEVARDVSRWRDGAPTEPGNTDSFRPAGSFR